MRSEHVTRPVGHGRKTSYIILAAIASSLICTFSCLNPPVTTLFSASIGSRPRYQVFNLGKQISSYLLISCTSPPPLLSLAAYWTQVCLASMQVIRAVIPQDLSNSAKE
jgi:hypothetical protein